MSAPSVSLAFFKLNVADMDAMLGFYGDVFGFSVTATYDVEDFLEHILALPGQEAGPNLMLVSFKDGRDVSVGPGHGPIGLVTDDLETLHGKVLAAGGKQVTGIFALDGVRLAIVLDPEGHEIELLQFTAA